MDRVFLIGLLALALTVNALILLVVLRRHVGGRRDHPVTTGAYQGPLPEVRPALAAAVTAPVPGLVTAPVPATTPAAIADPSVSRLDTVIASGRSPDPPAQSWSTLDTQSWASRVKGESARSAVFGRSTAIVQFRLDVIDARDELEPGAPIASHDDVRAAILGELQAAARSIDFVQADTSGTFRCLLVETDDHGAKEFADQVIRDLRRRLAEDSPNLRLVAGWASAAGDASLELAERLADARMTGAVEGWIRSAAVATS